MASGENSRRRFLLKTLNALLAGIALGKLETHGVSGARRSPRTSWRKAKHFTVRRKLEV